MSWEELREVELWLVHKMNKKLKKKVFLPDLFCVYFELNFADGGWWESDFMLCLGTSVVQCHL